MLTIEGYAEEGAKLRNGDKYLDLFNEVHDLALKHLEIVHTSIHEDKAVNVYDMLQEVRELRKKIMYKLFNIEPELNESVKQEVIPDQWRWSELKPKTKAEREELLKKFGARCFLGPKSLKFPICAYPSGAISCDGLRAAYVRARSLMGATKDRHPELYKYSKIAERALELAKKFGCEWVKGHEEVREGEEFFRELEEELEEQSPIRWTGGKRYLVKTLKQSQKYGFRVVEVTTRYELGKTPSNGSKLAKELLIMNF